MHGPFHTVQKHSADFKVQQTEKQDELPKIRVADISARAQTQGQRKPPGVPGRRLDLGMAAPTPGVSAEAEESRPPLPPVSGAEMGEAEVAPRFSRLSTSKLFPPLPRPGDPGRTGTL